MKKIIASAVIASLSIIGVPSQVSANTNVEQVTLAKYSTGAYSLTRVQKSQIVSKVYQRSDVEKAICTGIIHSSYKSAQKILVRNRAKAACEYAKLANPNLKTWYQSKLTKSKSMAGRVLLTTKLVTVETPATTPSTEAKAPSIPSTPATSLTNNLEQCKLRETANSTGAGPKGFPARTRGAVSNTGTVKIVIAPFDYVGNEGTEAELAKYLTNLERDIEAWGTYWSRGTMTYDVVIAGNEWIRVQSPLQSNLQSLVTASDPYANFSGAQFFFALFPKSGDLSHVNGGAYFYGDYSINTSEGSMGAFVYTFDGAREIGTNWSWMVHEALHPQGFIGHGPANGEQLGIMMADGQIRTSAITSWGAFLNGWWDESEVLCLDANSINESLNIDLNTLDNIGDGYESLMIRLSSEEVLVVERRGSGPWSSLGNFISAYRVNVNDAHFRCDMCSDRDTDKNFWYYIRENGSISIQNKITYKNITVSVKGAGRIEVTRG